MRGDIAQAGGGGERFEDAVGPDIADDLTDQRGRGARDQAAQRGCDAATFGIAKQRRHAGRSRHADLDRARDTAGAQLLEPGQNAFRIKRELADDVHAQILRGAGCDLLVERGFQPRGRNARMAFRIGADADLLDAGLAQLAFLDHRQRIGKRARRIDVAADHQQPPDIGFAAQGGEQFLQIGGRANAPRGDVDDRLEAGLAQQGGRADQLLRRDRRHRREIDRRFARHDIGERRDLGRARARRLDGELLRKSGGGHGRDARSLSPARDHEAFVVEPQAAVLLQRFARRLDVAAVAIDVGQAVVLDLGDVDRRVPGGEQRRGADR